MSTLCQSLLGFLAAREAHLATVHANDGSETLGSEIEDTAQRLAQAGDALEGELRRMMREEVARSGGVRANIFERG